MARPAKITSPTKYCLWMGKNLHRALYQAAEVKGVKASELARRAIAEASFSVLQEADTE